MENIEQITKRKSQMPSPKKDLQVTAYTVAHISFGALSGWAVGDLAVTAESVLSSEKGWPLRWKFYAPIGAFIGGAAGGYWRLMADRAKAHEVSKDSLSENRRGLSR